MRNILFIILAMVMTMTGCASFDPTGGDDTYVFGQAYRHDFHAQSMPAVRDDRPVAGLSPEYAASIYGRRQTMTGEAMKRYRGVLPASKANEIPTVHPADVNALGRSVGELNGKTQ